MATWHLGRPDPAEYAGYYGPYIGRVPHGNILEILERQLPVTTALLRSIPDARRDHRYAPGKWSLIDVVGHLVDTERVFGARALAFARSDPAHLPGFEQDDYVAAAGFHRRTLDDLATEFEHQRLANLALFRSFDDATAMRRGIANAFEFTARSVPFILAGHELHHRGVIEERYLGVPRSDGA